MGEVNIGLIGAGHMNSAIIQGLLQDDSKTFSAQSLRVSTKTPERATKIRTQFSLDASTDNASVIAQSRYIVLGVKPQQMQALLEEISTYDLSNRIFITIAAGLRIADYHKIINNNVVIVRAMPNVAAACQSALTGLYCDKALDDVDSAIIEAIFSAIGTVIWLDDEIQLDGITALSGSGIAYFFRLMQSMQKAGERYGFTGDELFDILSLTALGAATLALEHGEKNTTEDGSNFADLVDKIAIPNGTTAEAMRVFSQAEIDTVTERAMQAVIDKSTALSENLTKDW